MPMLAAMVGSPIECKAEEEQQPSRRWTKSDAGAMIPVAIFAHNEARHIERCLRSFAVGAPGLDLRFYVLCNGNTDGTNAIVAEYATLDPRVSLVDIALGDKCNAWNVYVHEIAPDADVHIFMDGDCELGTDAIPRMLETLRSSPQASAVSTFPLSGRSIQQWRRNTRDQHGITGNLYGLRRSFVERIRAQAIRLPVGFVGDDSLLGSLAAWNLDPKRDWDAKNRVAICEGAGFRFDSISYWSFNDLMRQMRRMVRYSRRRYEMQMINDILRSEGIAGLPRDTSELYRRRRHLCRWAWRGIWTPFDLIALGTIHK
jgi:cellulose synthase/poly-beta-1,6-N-acetylglucosamine synthase-like glycosyltransferase